jgi:hypothetical protein
VIDSLLVAHTVFAMTLRCQTRRNGHTGDGALLGAVELAIPSMTVGSGLALDH